MPKIPEYTPQVSPSGMRVAPQQGIAASTGTGAARAQQQLGQAVERAGDTINRLETARQGERDTERALAATAALNIEAGMRLAEAKAKQGANAWGETKRVEQWWQKAVERHGANLENDRQRQAFTAKARGQWSTAKPSVYTHELGEQRRATNDAAKASIQSAIDYAVANYADPAQVQQAVTDVSRTVYVQEAVNNGWTKEVADQVRTEHLTKLHQGVIEAQLDRSPAAARAYFEQNIDQIAGREHQGIRDMLDVGSRREMAQAFADEASARGLSEAEQLAEARKRYKGEDEDEVVAEVTRRAGLQQAAQRRAQEATYMEADAVLMQGGDYGDIPTTMLAKLKPEDRVRLRNPDYGRYTDELTYYSLHQQATNDPEGFAKADLVQHFPKLKETHRAEFIRLQQAMLADGKSGAGYGRRAGGKSDDPKVATARTKMQILQQGMVDAGLKPEELGKKGADGDKARRFARYVDDQLIPMGDWTQADLLRVVDDASREVIRKGWIWDSEEPQGAVEIEGVPRELVPDLADDVRGAGKPVTDENIKARYEYLKAKGQI